MIVITFDLKNADNFSFFVYFIIHYIRIIVNIGTIQKKQVIIDNKKAP